MADDALDSIIAQIKKMQKELADLKGSDPEEMKKLRKKIEDLEKRLTKKPDFTSWD